MRIRFGLSVAALGVVVSSCSVVTKYTLDASAASLGIDALFPSSWRPADSDSADVRISASTVWGAAEPDIAADCRVVSASLYAVAADWLDARNDYAAGLDDAIAAAEPLDSISMPRKILSYEGRYPGDEGYALLRRVVVRVYIAPESVKRGLGRLRINRLKTEIEHCLAGLSTASRTAGLSWLGAVGDVMPGRGSSTLLLGPDGPSRVFMRLLPLMRRQDTLFANLETAVTDRGVEWPKTFRFRIRAAVLRPLIDSGIDVVGIANNHVYDYTEVGFSNTLDALKAAGLPFVGAGRTFEEALTPFETALGADRMTLWALGAFPIERTGFSGLTHASVQRGKPGLLWADDAAVAAIGAAMKTRRASADGQHALFVVSVHAGSEYVDTPNATQTRLYRRLVDLGADVILGHHPHVLQPMEWYVGPERSGLIVYSLGNFLFDGMETIPKGMETAMLSVGVSAGAVRAIRIFPARLKGRSVDLDDGTAIETRFRDMSRAWRRRSQ